MEVKSLSCVKTLDNHKDRVWSIALHPTENLFATCGSDLQIIVWEYSLEFCNAKVILSESHEKTIRSIAWDYSGSYLASCSFDGKVNIWRKKNNDFTCIASLEGHENEVKSVAFSISGNFLATCSRDKTIWIWDIEENDQFTSNTILQTHSQDVKMIKWDKQEDILYSCSYDNTIKVWRFEESIEDWEDVQTLTEHKSTVWCTVVKRC